MSGSVAVPGDRDRPGVRGVGQQGAQRHHQLGAELLGGGQQLGAELPPAHVRLDAAQQDHVAQRARAASRPTAGWRAR